MGMTLYMRDLIYRYMRSRADVQRMIDNGMIPQGRESDCGLCWDSDELKRVDRARRVFAHWTPETMRQAAEGTPDIMREIERRENDRITAKPAAGLI